MTEKRHDTDADKQRRYRHRQTGYAGGDAPHDVTLKQTSEQAQDTVSWAEGVWKRQAEEMEARTVLIATARTTVNGKR